MSYHFTIIGTLDNPLFTHDFGTSKQGGDGQPRFSEQARHMNQFITHSSLDIVEEVQWGGKGDMYLKCVDRFAGNWISCWVTGGSAFMCFSFSLLFILFEKHHREGDDFMLMI